MPTSVRMEIPSDVLKSAGLTVSEAKLELGPHSGEAEAREDAATLAALRRS